MCDQKGNIILKRPPGIPIMFKSTTHLQWDQYPLCLASKLATTKAKSSDVITSKPVINNEGALSWDQYESGGSIVTDQFIVKTAGRLQQGYGCETADTCFSGGTIFQDTASNLVCVQPHMPLDTGETVSRKSYFED